MALATTGQDTARDVASSASRLPPAPLPWRAIATGSLGDRAVSAIRTIASHLEQTDAETIECSLASGAAGIAVFFHYLIPTGLFARAAAERDRFLGAAFDHVANRPTTTSLMSGFVGVGWAAQHLSTDGAGLDAVDAVLLTAADRGLITSHFDLIHGLAGISVYARERGRQSRAWELNLKVVDGLQRRARHVAEGATWFSGAQLLADDELVIAPDGLYNLGIAHGAAGVAVALGYLADDPTMGADARTLAQSAFDWVMAHQGPDAAASSLPSWKDARTGVPKTAGFAWCYGDLGTAAAFAQAALALDDRRWREAADHMAARSLPLARRLTRMESGLCHGFSGNAHLYNRLFHATGNDAYRETALHFLLLALDTRIATLPTGFYSWDDTRRPELVPRHDHTLLTGCAGVGLALLAAVFDTAPSWDRSLLLSR